jgi:oligopeptide/dipeptide ABC transporter ATP-binding protein
MEHVQVEQTEHALMEESGAASSAMVSKQGICDVHGEEILLDIQNLKLYFFTLLGVVKALEGVDLRLWKGDTLGLVGETGCGKSVTALSTVRLIPVPPAKILDGRIVFDGKDLTKLDEADIRRVRGHRISVVFQEPTTSLNPVMKVGDQVAEVIMVHQDLAAEALEEKIGRLMARETWLESRGLSAISSLLGLEKRIKDSEERRKNPPKPSRRDLHQAALAKTVQLLQLTGLPDPERNALRYPHELSGGMRQRVMIAIALACNPDLLIADEPTSSLDATIQAQIIALMMDLKRQIGSSILLITHHLGLVAHMCNRVAVMYAGQVVEYADTEELFKNPIHPYTKALLRAVPKARGETEILESIPGTVPDLLDPPRGCRFHPRCKSAADKCRQHSPTLIEINPNHFVSCHR